MSPSKYKPGMSMRQGPPLAGDFKERIRAVHPNHSSRIKALALALSMSVMSCSHVQLQLPNEEASQSEREAAYQQFRPIRLEGGARWSRTILLGGGQRIENPSDLLMVVSPTSATAQAIHRFEERNRPWTILGPTAIYSAVAGVVLLAGSGALLLAKANVPKIVPDAMLWVGVPLTILVPMVCLLLGWLWAPTTDFEWKSVFTHYDEDLRKAMDLPALPDPKRF